jgi:surfeit locus 1 family protein
MRRLGFSGLLIALITAFLLLGIWQVQRLMWKQDLIQRVNARVQAAPVTAPDPEQWAFIREVSDEYRHVTLTGHFLNDQEAQVYTLSDLGAGYWVMTPLKADNGMIVFVNRGFVPMDRRVPATRHEGQVAGPVRITGLLRLSQPKGWLFSQANDPAHDQWYRRDLAALGQSRGLPSVAPYFIDADATPNVGDWPRGGLTVIRFANSHLVYALTWFSLAGMLLLVAVRFVWRRKEKTGEV